MRALNLVADRKVELVELDDPPAPAAGEVQVRIRAVALNHIDVWGYRGMAFAKRKMPLVVGAEAAGEVAAVGPGGGGASRSTSSSLRSATRVSARIVISGVFRSLPKARHRWAIPRR